MSHTSREFEAELRELRAHSLAMGARCERILRIALDAFWGNAEVLTQQVKELDRQIDRDEMDIDALVLRVLALRQPVAYDLRFLATALKLVTDLERIGDEAVNISEGASEEGADARLRVKSQLSEMGELAQEMVRDALDAFVNADIVRANEVLTRDDQVDSRYREVVKIMMDFMAQAPGQVPAAVCVIKVAKHIERVADHATNIAEETIFMVRGEDVRHLHSHLPPNAEERDKK